MYLTSVEFRGEITKSRFSFFVIVSRRHEPLLADVMDLDDDDDDRADDILVGAQKS